MIHTRECLKVFHQDNSIQTTVYISFRCSILIVEYSLQHKGRQIIVSVSRPHLHIGSIVSLKLCQNLSPSLHWFQYDWRHEDKSPVTILWKKSSLKPFVSCIAKKKFSLGPTNLRIISLNLSTNTISQLFSLNAHHSRVFISFWHAGLV